MGGLDLIVLGSAAGGGFPQWNCACTQCVACRGGSPTARPRRQASLAVRVAAAEWLVVNATADVGEQVAATPALHPGPGVRDTPIRRVLLTDAQLDHVVGLLDLRNAGALEVLAPESVIAALHDDLRLDRILAPYLRVRWTGLPVGRRVDLADSDVWVQALPVGDTPPRYRGGGGDGTAWSVAYAIGDNDASCVYAPTAATICGVEQAMSAAACVFFDGTFWDDDEPARAGVGARTAREMGHLPVSGPDGSLTVLSRLGKARRIYTHLNNTNPLVDDASWQADVLCEVGVEVARDGEAIRL